MAAQTVIWPEGQSEQGSVVTTSAVIERAGRPMRLWFRVPAAQRAAVTERAEPFVLAALFLAMRDRTDLVVHGEVSPSLLRNLDEFQTAWHCWLPDAYERVEIIADAEREVVGNNRPEHALVAFSGGVDSSFTVFRHRKRLAGRSQREVSAAIMVQGFDIPLNQPYIFQRSLNRAKEMLDSLDVELIPVGTNFRELGLDWRHCFAAAAASCLSLFQKGHDAGLIASGEPYSSLVLPWGSTPLTDHLLSSRSFEIVHDGAGFSRSEKVRVLAGWPEALRHLRVCWEGGQLDRNCGRCEKCIRTALNFRVNGMSLPESFQRDVTDAEIVRLRVSNRAQLSELKLILKAASEGSFSRESWAAALARCVRRNERRLKLDSVIRKLPVRKIAAAVPWRVRLFLSRYAEERAALPREKIFILKDDSETLGSLLERIRAVADSPSCKKIVASVERDKRKTIKKLGDMPADPSPLEATRYTTEAQALRGCATPSVGGRLLFAVASVLQPNWVIEIGTAHGYGALYIGSALRATSKGKLLTLAGMAVRVKLSRAAIRRFGLAEYVEVLDGDFRLTFNRALERAKPLDLVFFDGDKQPESTALQFAAALQAMERGGYLMFDDINFSDEMRRFWSDALELDRVSGAISFYDRWGLIRVKPSVHSAQVG
ncbi:MAG TPA: class I SAM-dependent methyltransferase [Candidatus Acidoferrales bacterium]|nr:class I SAM-dependent methyltransferase [Candidatus Acidoferrales bacterium]